MGASAAYPVAPNMSSGLTPQQQMILNEFNGQTYEPNRMDVQDTPLYDTVSFAAGTTITTAASYMFVNVQGKTVAQTNVQNSKKLDAPEAFTIKSYRFYWQQNVLLADLYAILVGAGASVLEFYIGNKVYQRGPLWNYAPGGGPVAFSTGTGFQMINNGWQGRSEMNRIAINVVIDNQASFFAQLNTTGIALTTSGAGGTGFTYQLMLSGLYARGVQ
jgi:hypothetical protein